MGKKTFTFKITVTDPVGGQVVTKTQQVKKRSPFLIAKVPMHVTDANPIKLEVKVLATQPCRMWGCSDYTCGGEQKRTLQINTKTTGTGNAEFHSAKFGMADFPHEVVVAAALLKKPSKAAETKIKQNMKSAHKKVLAKITAVKGAVDKLSAAQAKEIEKDVANLQAAVSEAELAQVQGPTLKQVAQLTKKLKVISTIATVNLDKEKERCLEIKPAKSCGYENGKKKRRGKWRQCEKTCKNKGGNGVKCTMKYAGKMSFKRHKTKPGCAAKSWRTWYNMQLGKAGTKKDACAGIYKFCALDKNTIEERYAPACEPQDGCPKPGEGTPDVTECKHVAICVPE